MLICAAPITAFGKVEQIDITAPIGMNNARKPCDAILIAVDIAIRLTISVFIILSTVESSNKIGKP